MKIDVLTLFPEMFTNVFATSILGRAVQDEHVELETINFRDYANNIHNKVDDYPYGGGAGLVLSVEPIYNALNACLEARPEITETQREVIMLTPQGEPFTHNIAVELTQKEHLVFICGHYEGFDERVREHLVTRELSIGDFVLTGGEIPAMAMIDATVRLLPGVIKHSSAHDDSFANGMLEYPQYTRPSEFNGWKVPNVLLSGHHVNIEKWRQDQSLLRTQTRRPDLLEESSEE